MGLINVYPKSIIAPARPVLHSSITISLTRTWLKFPQRLVINISVIRNIRISRTVQFRFAKRVMRWVVKVLTGWLDCPQNVQL